MVHKQKWTLKSAFQEINQRSARFSRFRSNLPSTNSLTRQSMPAKRKWSCILESPWHVCFSVGALVVDYTRAARHGKNPAKRRENARQINALRRRRRWFSPANARETGDRGEGIGDPRAAAPALKRWWLTINSTFCLPRRALRHEGLV
jgi:hypothetical protein